MALETGLVGAGAAFASTLLVQRALAPVAQHLDLLDYPVGRKDHAHPTPVTGGLAMLAGVLLAATLILTDIGPGAWGLAFAAGVLVVVGLLDDKYDLSWRLRIPAQAIAALIMIEVGGVRVEHLGSVLGLGEFPLGALSVPFTVFATVGIINAVNMIDGVDGLAGVLVLAALVMLGAAALHSGNTVVCMHALILAGAVSGFLVYNLRFPWQRRAKVFMGNAGSAFLGLAIAWIAFRLTQNPAHPVTPALAPWLLPVPIVDCLVLMLRRTRNNQSPFLADRNHIHHLMLEAGFAPMRAVFVLALFSCGAGLAAALALRLQVPSALLLVAFFGLCGSWYWLTSRRTRAIGFLRGVRGLLSAAARTDEPTAARAEGGHS